jgi:hypothetical protein
MAGNRPRQTRCPTSRGVPLPGSQQRIRVILPLGRLQVVNCPDHSHTNANVYASIPPHDIDENGLEEHGDICQPVHGAFKRRSDWGH